MENKKQAIILSGVAIVALLALIIGATYAYFQVAGDSSKSTDVNVTTYTSDLLTFEMGSDIAIYATQTSFGSGKGNATGSTFAKAILTANSKTNKSTKRYFMYLNISENTFTYTQNEDTPELLLKVTDASGNEITSVTGLEHKTVTDGKGASISGFDITTKSGLITLFDNREITATPAKTEEWNVTVTFVNYNVNQTGNAGKSFDAKLMIQQKKLGNQTLAEYVISQYTGTQGKNSIYHHNSTLANGAGDNSYRYAGANPNNYVCFGSDATTCPEDNLYRIIGVFGNQVKLIKATIAKSNLLGTDGAYSSDTAYYWSTLSSCPSGTAYLGYDAINLALVPGKTNDGCNEWNYSDLNTTNLNTNFINNIGSMWANKISTTTWKVGGGTLANISEVVPAITYQYEVGTNASSTTYDAKIGLMYVSDYGFAAGPEAWTRTMDSYDDSTATSTNWLYSRSGSNWTISRVSSGSDSVFVADYVGEVIQDYLSNAVRPSFNLLSSVTYISGTGTSSDPIRIN